VYISGRLWLLNSRKMKSNLYWNFILKKLFAIYNLSSIREVLRESLKYHFSILKITLLLVELL